MIGRSIIWMDSEEIHEMEGEGSRIMKRLEGCTACVCYNDEIACKLVNILKGAGRGVPDDISIIGIDNSAFAEFCAVPLTSVVNPVEELGRTAARKITDRIVHGQRMETTEFQPEICIRDSVRMIRDGECGTFNPDLLACFFRVERDLRCLYQTKEEKKDG